MANTACEKRSYSEMVYERIQELGDKVMQLGSTLPSLKNAIVLGTMMFVSRLACGMAPDDGNFFLPEPTYETRESALAEFYGNGRRMMSLMGIPDGDESVTSANWSFPISIVTQSAHYSIETNTTTFTIYDEQKKRFGWGEYGQSGHAKGARLFTFSQVALGCSLSIDELARECRFVLFDSSTNAYCVSLGERLNVANMGNLVLTVHTCSNGVEITRAIIQAGMSH